MEHRKILHLTLKKKWFDMILSGEKTEEYREFKDYWLKRLTNFFDGNPFGYSFNHFDMVVFKHGYAKNAPTVTIECKGITEGWPRPEWSDNAQGNHIIIHLGKILSTANTKS